MVRFTFKNRDAVLEKLNKIDEHMKAIRDLAFGLDVDVDVEEKEPSTEEDGSNELR